MTTALQNIAKKAASVIFYRDESIMNSSLNDAGNAVVSWLKPDGEPFEIEVKVEGSQLIFRRLSGFPAPGRWMDHEDDEKITFDENGNVSSSWESDDAS